MRTATLAALAAMLAAWLAVPAPARADGPALVSPVAAAGDKPAPPWHVVGLPQQSKPFTRFSVVTLDGQRVLRVEAAASYGNLVHPLAEDPGVHRLSWRWRLDEALPGADLRRKEADDIALKVCAMFDLPMAALPFMERQELRVVRMASSEPLPSATVCYVWDPRLPPGTALPNAFTRRIRQIVLRGPETPLHAWVTEQRDVWADFLRLYADESETVPPMTGVLVGADADNTKGHGLGHVSAITLE